VPGHLGPDAAGRPRVCAGAVAAHSRVVHSDDSTAVGNETGVGGPSPDRRR
jgi:hypothetical protein